MTPMSNHLTETISIRVTKEFLVQIEAAAAAVGMERGVFCREALEDSLAVGTDKTALVEAVLQLTFLVGELAKAQGVGELTVKIVQDRARQISPVLLENFAQSRAVIGVGG